MKWSVGLIRTANVIDFVPLPTLLPLFFFFSLLVLAGTCRTLCPPTRATLVSYQNGRTFLDPAAINPVSGLLLSI